MNGALSLVVLMLVGMVLAVQPTERPPRLKLLSYNIRHGEGFDSVVDLERTARVIAEVSPTFVALQEVDRGVARSGGTDQAAALAEKLGLQAFFAPALETGGGEYGLAVLTSLPVLETRTEKLPGRGEPRIALAVKIQLERAEPLWVINTHFDHSREAVRAQQAEALATFAAGLDAPAVLVGDFNAEPESPELAPLAAGWDDGAASNPQGTFPSDAPDARIDLVWVPREAGWRSIQALTVEERLASDHKPLLVVLQFGE